jgi:hypothetical protein
MLLVPLAATPAQFFNVVLSQQACTIKVYQKFWGVFLDLLVDGNPIVTGVLCLNNNYLVRSIYLGFQGDLFFSDTQGASDPTFDGLGGRFVLVYVSPAELPDDYGMSAAWAALDEGLNET